MACTRAACITGGLRLGCVWHPMAWELKLHISSTETIHSIPSLNIWGRRWCNSPNICAARGSYLAGNFRWLGPICRPPPPRALGRQKYGFRSIYAVKMQWFYLERRTSHAKKVLQTTANPYLALATLRPFARHVTKCYYLHYLRSLIFGALKYCK